MNYRQRMLLGFVCIILAICIIVLLLPNVSAHRAGAHAFLLQDGGGGNQRCWWLEYNPGGTNRVCGTDGHGQGVLTLAPGACANLLWQIGTVGAAPPLAPDGVSIQVRYDNTGTIIRTYQNLGAQPADGTNFNFCATSNGDTNGSPRAGTFRIWIRARLIGVYDIDCDVQVHCGSVIGTNQVSSIIASAYPSGSTFAFGANADESVTITVSATTPAGDNGNRETVEIDIIRTSDLVQIVAGATVDQDGGTATDSFVINSLFDAAATSYGVAFRDIGLSGFCQTGCAGQGFDNWTIFATSGHGAEIIRQGDYTVRDNTVFNADPRLIFSTDGTTRNNDVVINDDVFNRGETVEYDLFIMNARDQRLTRAMTIEVLDTVGSTVVDSQSVTPGSPPPGIFSASYIIDSADPAENDLTGRAYRLRLSGNGAALHLSDTPQFFVSSLYRIHAHSQSNLALVEDEIPCAGIATDDNTFFINRHTFHGWAHVFTADCQDVDTSGSAVSMELTDPDLVLRDSALVDTGTNGWTVTSLDFVADLPEGDWQFFVEVAFNGNNGDNLTILNFSLAPPNANANLKLIVEPVIDIESINNIWLRVEFNNTCTVPDEIPLLTISFGNFSPTGWNTHTENVTFINAVNHTATVNGCVYYQNFTIEIPGTYHVQGAVLLNGTQHFASEAIDVFDTNLMTVTESLMPLLVFAILIVWMEITRDFTLGIITMLAGIFAVTTLTPEFGIIRTVLVAIMIFVGLRLFQNYQSMMNPEE